MKTDINDLRSQFFEEARSQRQTPPGEDEVTAAILAKELECSAPAARRLLAKMVKDGLATMRTNGPKNSNVYKKK